MDLNSGTSKSQTSVLRRRVLSGAIWITVANVAYRGALMLAMIVAARILGKESFGQLGIVQSSITMFEAMAAFGMGTTAVKHIAEYRRSNKAKVGQVIILTTRTTLAAGLVFGVTVYAFAPWLSRDILASTSLTDLIRIAAVVLCFNTLSGGQIGVLTGFEAYRSMAIINVVTGAATMLLVDLGAWYYGVNGALWGLAGASALNSLMNQLACGWAIRNEAIPKSQSLTRHEWRLLWHFSFPAMLAGLLYAPVNWIGGAYLVRTAGYGEMGLFSAANQWFSILLFLPGMITRVYLPVFADQVGQGSYLNFKKLLKQAIKVTLLISVPMVVAVSIASPWIMRFYGESYSGAEKLLIVIAVSAMVASTQNILGNALASVNRMWIHFCVNLVWALVYLIFVPVLIEIGYKAMALCLAILLAYLLKLLFASVLVRRYIIENRTS